MSKDTKFNLRPLPVSDFQRFSQYLTNLKQTARQGPDFQRDVSSLIGFLD
jgi:hypothetical protein